MQDLQANGAETTAGGKIPRTRLLDSPWYWAYVFCTAALVALMIMQPKFSKRQTLDEQNYQGRQRANQRAVGDEPSVPLSTQENRVITLTPLYVLLGIGFFVCWCLVWWQLMGKKWWSKRHTENEVA